MALCHRAALPNTFLAIHQQTVVACVLLTDSDGTSQRCVRTFGTMTADLLALS